MLCLPMFSGLFATSLLRLASSSRLMFHWGASEVFTEESFRNLTQSNLLTMQSFSVITLFAQPRSFTAAEDSRDFEFLPP